MTDSAATAARDEALRIIDTSRQPLLVLDEGGVVRAVNEPFCDVFRVPRAEVESRPLAKAGDGAWLTTGLASALSRLLEGPDGEGRFDALRTTFGGREVLVSGQSLLSAIGRRWALLSFEDLSERRRDEALAARRERALRHMLEAASESIFFASAAGQVAWANAMAEQTFGYGRGELVGVAVDALVPEELRSAHARHRADYIADPRPRRVETQALQALRKDGTRFPVEVSLSTMDGEDGPLVVLFISDISRRRESEARIAAYQKNLQKMAFDATVAEEQQRRALAAELHDNVGQALALALLRFKSVLPAASGTVAKELAEGIRLVDAALRDTRELTFELSPPVLYDLGLPAAVGWLGEQFEQRHHLRVQVRHEEPWERLGDDVERLAFRSVRELLTNVAKHAKTADATVTLRRGGAHLGVVVHDDGAGFDPAELEGRARSFGLFSVREQVQHVGGTFTLESAPGRGTRVTLQVPVATPG